MYPVSNARFGGLVLERMRQGMLLFCNRIPSLTRLSACKLSSGDNILLAEAEDAWAVVNPLNRLSVFAWCYQSSRYAITAVLCRGMMSSLWITTQPWGENQTYVPGCLLATEVGG